MLVRIFHHRRDGSAQADARTANGLEQQRLRIFYQCLRLVQRLPADAHLRRDDPRQDGRPLHRADVHGDHGDRRRYQVLGDRKRFRRCERDHFRFRYFVAGALGGYRLRHLRRRDRDRWNHRFENYRQMVQRQGTGVGDGPRDGLRPHRYGARPEHYCRCWRKNSVR